MKVLILIFITLISTSLFAQDESLAYFICDTTNQQNDTLSILDFETKNKGRVTIIKDTRVDGITEFVGRQRESIQGSLINGYRIQIFFNESRSVAQSQKAGFINSHSEHKAYIDYLAPNYRVRVGNFRTKLQAEKFKQELISIYPTCIVLKEKIELPNLSSQTETN